MTEQPRLPGDASQIKTAPLDQGERDRIRVDLETTLFVEAGAGSGKTTALVARILALVESGVELEHIAAITFTEKAAAELRQRIRDAIEKQLRSDDARAHMRSALNQVDAAAICTLHAFAQRILFEHPIEAGLPPGVEVLDELSSQVDFEERWEEFIPELLGHEDMIAPLLVGDVLGIRIPELRSLAQQFESNWDLLQHRLPETAPLLNVNIESLIEQLRTVGRAAAAATDSSDQRADLLEAVLAYADDLEHADTGSGSDPVDRLIDIAEQLNREKPSFGVDGHSYKRKGNKRNWPSADHLENVKLALWEVGESRDRVRSSLTNAAIEHLAVAIGGFVLQCVERRRVEGRLRFHDLLVLARDVMRTPETGSVVRASLRERYQRLLIDEFQDTDPIQVDLSVLMAADSDQIDRHWSEIAITPGRLFFVGDPKQSIYRFRRADITTYLQAQALFGATDDQVHLTSNFRSTAPVIEWVNRTFARLIEASEDSQPGYVALDCVRPEADSGPGVMVLGADPNKGAPRAAELRALEAADVAAAVVEAVTDGWSVEETAADGTKTQRSARLGDVTILLPARTSLPALEQALELADIAYRAETASLVYSTAEIRDLLMIARAVDDPTDELAAVMALRSPGFGCGDDDLYTYKRELGGGWNHQQIAEELTDSSPVVRGLAWMGALHRERAWRSPAQVLERIVRDRQLLALGVCQQRHREVWRRLRFVIDQARAWTDATTGDLRQYLSWVHLQASDSARVAETVLPETDTDAVRIMTIHASKGLEFPITIVSGLTTKMQQNPGGVHVVWPNNDTIGYKLGSGNTTPIYEDFVPVDEQLDAHERLRLLYVACTRASDHLVVSLHRSERPNGSLANALADAEAAEGMACLRGITSGLAAPSEPGEPRSPLPSLNQWKKELSDVLANSRQSHTIAATTLAQLAAQQQVDPGLQKAGRDIDLPPWRKGRYGTAVGRAVHAVLQTIDLSTAHGLPEAARAQAAAEGVLGKEDDIAALCRSALRSDVVRAASQTRHWREIFVAAPIGGRLLEGYIDLLYQSNDGLVVVDHKTDAWRDEHELAAKVERYRIQTAAYAVAVEAATGLQVKSAVLLFLSPDIAIERVVPELSTAKEEVRSLIPNVVAGGEEVTAGDY